MNPPLSELDDFRLMPAPVDRFRRAPTHTLLRVPIRGSRGSPAATRDAQSAAVGEIPLPFFWYDPPWHRADVERCRLIADWVGRCGVTIAALQSELSDDDRGLEGITWPRIAPHRCDRAGWTLADCQSATLIELRLGMNRNAAGSYAYSAAELSRWYPKDEPPKTASGETWVPLLFPPEWADLSQMGTKISQLRLLSEAAVYVSCDEANLEEVLPVACSGGADGVILRCQDDPVAALQRSAAILNTSSGDFRPSIWLAGGRLGPQDAVKCLALGAAAVSIDWMCNRWLLGEDEEQLTSAQRAAINLGVSVGQSVEERLQARVGKQLQAYAAEVAGIVQSLLVEDVAQLNPGHLFPWHESNAPSRPYAGR